MRERLRSLLLPIAFFTSYLGVITTASAGLLPKSELVIERGKYTSAIEETIKKGGGIAVIVIMGVGFIVFSTAIINAFWKMRRGEFELSDLGTVVVTGAISAGLVVYALNEAKGVLG